MNRKKIFSFFIVFIIVAFGVLYNFLLHRSFWPDPEYVIRQYGFFIDDVINDSYTIGNRLSNIIALLAYKIDGFGIRSIRIEASLLYGIVLMGAVIASLYAYDEAEYINKNLYLVSLLVFLLILINPGSSLYCGQYSDTHHSYPYDFHIDTQMYAVWGIVILFFVNKIKDLYKKYFLIVCYCVVTMMLSDVMYVLTFVCPIILYMFLSQVNRDGKRVWKIGCFIAGIIALGRIASIYFTPLKFLYTQSINPNWVDGSSVYGDDGFGDTTEVFNRISIVTTELMAIFNIELTGKQIVNICNVVNFVRIVILIIIICNAVANVKNKFSNKKVELIDFVLGMGFILNIVFLILTKHGGLLKCNRYLVVAFWYGSILFIRFLHKKCYQNDHAKFIFLLFVFLVMLNISNVTEDNLVQPYERQMVEVADVIDENNLGDGISLCDNQHMITALLQGQYIILKAELNEDGIIVNNRNAVSKISYIIIDENNTNTVIEYLNNNNLEADSYYELESYVILYFDKGLDI